MFTFIAFLLTLTGCANWLMIGLLQYDFIAGLFGWQGSMFSRLCYILIGVGATYLVVRVIVNKGTFKIFEKKKKNQVQEQSQTQNLAPQTAGAEAASEQIPQKPIKKKKWWQFWKKKEKNLQPMTQQPSSQPQTPPQQQNTSQSQSPANTPAPNSPDSIFDEHFEE